MYKKNLQQWWFDDGFGLKIVYLWRFCVTSSFKVFINIREYANEISFMSDHMKNDTCLSFNVVPNLVL